MPAPYNLMGFHRQLYVGTAGSAGTNRITNCTDINHDIAVTYGSTKKRGDGSVVPIATEKATERKPSITWTMNNEPNDGQLILLRAAAKAGGAMAIVLKERNAAGVETVIFDGDCNIKVSEKDPVGGESTFDFEGSPSRDYGRDPVF